MRHRKNTKTLGRKSNARKALMRTLLTSLVMHERITTTQTKAKLVRSAADRLVTTAKPATLAGRRQLRRVLTTEDAVNKMLTAIAPRFTSRNGGYTRLIKLKNRQGDHAPLVKVEFVS